MRREKTRAKGKAKAGRAILAAAMLLGIVLAGGKTSVYAEDLAFEGMVQDDARLLDAEEEAALEQECGAVLEEYGIGAYIVTTQDFGGGDIKDWQRRVFEACGLGKDCGGNGVMLAISMAERDWGLVAFGTAQSAFTTYGRERMGELILDDLSDGEFYEAFSEYLSMAQDYLKADREGTPYTEEHRYGEGYRIPLIIGVSFVLSLAVSLAVLFSWKKSMNTRIRQDGAMAYFKEGSLRLDSQTDQFLYHNITRTKIQKADTSGGSAMHSDSSGTSGKF